MLSELRVQGTKEQEEATGQKGPADGATSPHPPPPTAIKDAKGKVLAVGMDVVVSTHPKNHASWYVAAKATVANLNASGTAKIGAVEVRVILTTLQENLHKS